MSLIVKETNSYAFRNNSASNPWVSLSIKELYQFFGCLLLLALHGHPPRTYSWHSNGVLARTPLSKNRFEQIIKNIHFKDRGLNSVSSNWWDKLEPIFSILRGKSAFYWLPSTNLTVDEVMLKFEGRTSQKVTIPCKPIPTGFKLFALGDSGYIYNWECTRPGLAEGLVTVKKRVSLSISTSNGQISTFLNPTQSVVIRLANSLSKHVENGRFFHFFLDNLFVCIKSALTLKEREIAVTETVRKSATSYLLERNSVGPSSMRCNPALSDGSY